MKLMVNDKDMEFPEGMTITQLLEQLGLLSGRVVVERNESEIISRSKFDQVILEDGDKLEILNFVGGGSKENTPFLIFPFHPEGGNKNRCIQRRKV